MLSKINRFHGHQSVRRVYRQGSAVRGNNMSLHVYSNDRLQKTKAAIVVSKKVDKSAVKRNRIRRRIYELVRLNIAELDRPAELVFTVYRPETAEVSAEILTSEVKTLLHRAKLL